MHILKDNWFFGSGPCGVDLYYGEASYKFYTWFETWRGRLRIVMVL